MTEFLLFLVGVLLAITVSASIEYYRYLRRVREEYAKAKEVVDDIVLSLNRQIRREAEKVERVAYKAEANSAKIHDVLDKVEEISKSLHTLDAKVVTALESGERMLARLDEVDKKIHDTAASQEMLNIKISEIEEKVHLLPATSEAKTEAVIPIKREKAMAPLTETEVSVLEMLAMEGPKTAPEIKERIKLSREHTARLMKKLYEEGYLERETSKIPFRYSVKKEMEKLLKKAEPEQG